MEHILLVEPDYDNKYPPIGLMKIATYYKSKGDYVEFYKGKAPYNLISKMDRVYITTLFTFYFDMTVDTIKHYLKYTSHKNVYVGGISATLMPDKYIAAVGNINVLTGQLTSSNILGYSDNVNIDILPLDYDILDDVDYDYGVSDNFFAYSTRGCPRKCKFCAVQTLEPEFINTNHLKNQIEDVRNIYGDKRHIMMMDNNVIFSNELEKICRDLNALGFIKDKATYIPPNPAELFYKKIRRRVTQGLPTWKVEDAFYLYLVSFAKRIKKSDIQDSIQLIIQQIEKAECKRTVYYEHEKFIVQTVEKYRSKKPLQRYVDFNQGLDARLLTEEKMEILSRLPLRPFRLAYDDLKTTDEYVRAFKIAYKYGVRHFSNYMLYNFNDTPEELWRRVYNNIVLYESYEDVTAFSFPMKYAPVDRTDRNYVGKHWNKKYLSAMNVILNVTKGVIAKERDFFERAFGKSEEEFLLILSMPNEFIKYRAIFEDNGLIDAWKKNFVVLTQEERATFLCELIDNNISEKYKPISKYYRITKSNLKDINMQDYL